MAENTSKSAAARFRLVADLYEMGVQMTRQRLRREHPHAKPAEIERMLDEWLRRAQVQPPLKIVPSTLTES